jgi:vitellogenic carboxypeptidase-like protein
MDGVKEALGARGGMRFEACSAAVVAALREDGIKSAKPEVEALLRTPGIRVLLYEGIQDLRDGVASTEAWLAEVQWDGIAAFQEAEPRCADARGGVRSRALCTGGQRACGAGDDRGLGVRGRHLRGR